MEPADRWTGTGRSTRTLVVRDTSAQQCLPLKTNTYLFYSGICQPALAPPIVWVTFVSSVLTDIYLILIPLPMLWGTSLKLVKKILSSFVLGAGVFVLVCSLLKTVFVEIVRYFLPLIIHLLVLPIPSSSHPSKRKRF